MLAIEKIERVANLVVCVKNDGYEIDLELHEPYEVVPDDTLEPDDMRVIDETAGCETAYRLDRARGWTFL